MSNSNPLILGITIGDINGIGLEVILKTLTDKRILTFCTPVIYGSSKVVSYHKNVVPDFEAIFHNAYDVHSIKHGQVNVVNCWKETVNINLGKLTVESGEYALKSLAAACDDLDKGLIDGIVTAPLNKKAMEYVAEFDGKGHTEYLTRRFGAQNSLMLLVSDRLRVGLVTNHIPINEVANKVTEDAVLEKITVFHRTLREDFGIDSPMLAVLGLNPHAGDGGSIGDEDEKIIAPAIAKAKEQGLRTMGPYPADGFFGSGSFRTFDGVLAMYHDQGLVAFKTLSFGEGVNFTAGLQVVRTSPDHGTGYDIAGKNQADPSSFRKAMFTALDVIKHRRRYREMHDNPVERLQHAPDSGKDDPITEE